MESFLNPRALWGTIGGKRKTNAEVLHGEKGSEKSSEEKESRPDARRGEGGADLRGHRPCGDSDRLPCASGRTGRQSRRNRPAHERGHDRQHGHGAARCGRLAGLDRNRKRVRRARRADGLLAGARDGAVGELRLPRRHAGGRGARRGAGRWKRRGFVRWRVPCTLPPLLRRRDDSFAGRRREHAGSAGNPRAGRKSGLLPG